MDVTLDVAMDVTVDIAMKATVDVTEDIAVDEANKWFQTRQCLASFPFVIIWEILIKFLIIERILWKCKTLKGESICFHEKSDAWI